MINNNKLLIFYFFTDSIIDFIFVITQFILVIYQNFLEI